MSKNRSKKQQKRKNRKSHMDKKRRNTRYLKDVINYDFNAHIFKTYKDSTDAIIQLWTEVAYRIAKYADSELRKAIREIPLGPSLNKTHRFNAQMIGLKDLDCGAIFFDEQLFVVTDSITAIFCSHAYLIHKIRSRSPETATIELQDILLDGWNSTEVPPFKPALKIIKAVESQQTYHPNDRQLPKELLQEFSSSFGQLYPYQDKTDRYCGLIRTLVASHEISHYLLGHSDVSPSSSAASTHAQSIVDNILSDFTAPNLDTELIRKNIEIHCDVLGIYLTIKSIGISTVAPANYPHVAFDLYFSARCLADSLKVMAGNTSVQPQMDKVTHPHPDIRFLAMSHAINKTLYPVKLPEKKKMMVDYLSYFAQTSIINYSTL